MGFTKEVEMDYVLKSIREELDDHRDAINHNTDEIGGNHEIMYQMMAQLDKMSERIDSMALYLKRKDSNFKDDNLVDIKPLTRREKEVFVALYELTQSQPAVSYRDLAKSMGLPVSNISGYVCTLIEKGVPVEKTMSKGTMFLGLKKSFARLQAKNNIMGVDAKLTAFF